jgi:hypothetical protein
MLYVMDCCPRAWNTADISVVVDLALAATELTLRPVSEENAQLVERERRAEGIQQLAATLARVAACADWEAALRELLIRAIDPWTATTA